MAIINRSPYYEVAAAIENDINNSEHEIAYHIDDAIKFTTGASVIESVGPYLHVLMGVRGNDDSADGTLYSMGSEQPFPFIPRYTGESGGYFTFTYTDPSNGEVEINLADAHHLLVFSEVDGSAIEMHETVQPTTTLSTINGGTANVYTVMYPNNCDWSPVAYNTSAGELQYYTSQGWVTVPTS